MVEFEGKFNKAKVFIDNVEETAVSQIIELCNQEFVQGSTIRIMPDTHAGAGCVIGTTMTIKDKVVPNLVGVDIGCGMLCVELGNIDLDLPLIDKFIRNSIPSGFKINSQPQIDFKDEINNLKCIRELKKSPKEFNKALGSLGGGNHFIEINATGENKYLVIHSGSRNMGLQIATYYQNKAFEYHSGMNNEYEIARENLIKKYKATNRKEEIQKGLANLKNHYKKESPIDKKLCYLEGQFMKDYLHDMDIAQIYSNINRIVMAQRIVKKIGLNYDDLKVFQTIHNYIDIENMMLRKGAVSAQKDEILLIPINMRDGSLLCKGKGNPDWNYSAPHGAGRLMSRTQANNTFKLDDFKASMEGIYTTSVNAGTLDEAPMAYKPIKDIVDNIQDTVEILEIIKPIYNFKAGK